VEGVVEVTIMALLQQQAQLILVAVAAAVVKVAEPLIMVRLVALAW
jgi:hypothetical protein